MLTCTHGRFVEPAPAWSSRDGGLTWSRVAASPDWGVAGDCEVAIGPDGAWHLLHSTVAGATIAWSLDGGTTWSSNPAAAVPVAGLADRPWLHADAAGLHLTYHDLYALPGSGVYRFSPDHGSSWDAPVTMALPTPDRPNLLLGHVATAPDGRLWVPVVRFLAGATVGLGNMHDVAFGALVGSGNSWTEVPVTGPMQARLETPTLAVAGNGSVAFFVATDGGLQIAWGDDRGFGALQPLATPGGGAGELPWAEAAGNYGVDVMVVADDAIWVARIDGNGTTWASPGPAVWPEYHSLAHDATGRVHVLYEDADAQPTFARET